MQAQRILVAAAVVAAVTVVMAIVLWPSTQSTRATGGNSITTPDTVGTVGLYTSLALDAAGNPVVSYFDTSSYRTLDLKVLHCGDPDCSSGNVIISPDTVGSRDGGQRTSLALDSSGYPVVSYWDEGNFDLKVLHCGDANCSSGNVITSPDTAGDVGESSSLALDASGNPVVTYLDHTNGDLKVLHCGDPNCSSGNVITSPDTAGFVGGSASLALDASGKPVVSYYDGSNEDLKVLHCGDANCSSGNVITSPDTAVSMGGSSSLALDASGNPVVGYYDYSNEDLKVLHCGDANCSSGNVITSPDTASLVGAWPSLALDGNGNPVVSYVDLIGFRLKVLHCGDANCTTGNSITSPDMDKGVGVTGSLALDASGNPVVSYYDGFNEYLKVLHCGDANCTVKPTPTPTPCGFPGPTCTPTPTPTVTPTATSTDTPTPTKQPFPGDTDGDGCPDADENGPDETLGGRRDYKSPWDYFNPTNDGQNRVDDTLVVVNHYFLSEGEPGYDNGKYDRSYVGPNDWNLGPPDGQVLVDDILHAVKQYFHDCG